MASTNPIIIVDDEAMERPPHTGIQQWAAMKQATGIDTTPSTSTTSVIQTSSSASEQTPSFKPQHRKATVSAYLHLPLTNPPKQSNHSEATTNNDDDDDGDASQAPKTYHVPPQQVCKNGARPTAVCGKWSPALNDPPKQPWTRDGTGPYKCPRCEVGFSRIDSVRLHFPQCVTTNGNPNCDAWTDHGSYWTGVAARRAARVGGNVGDGPYRPRANPAYFVNLTICELVMRVTTHEGWEWSGVEPPEGEELLGNEPEESKDKGRNAVARDLEETGDAQEISDETEDLISTFKEDDDLWDTESLHEAQGD